MFEVNDNFDRPDSALVSGLGAIPVANLSDAMSNLNTMHSGINALVSDTRICGPATTAAARAGDMLSTLKALRLAREGDVLVIDNQGDPDSAMWGEITTQEAQNRGVLALVVAGKKQQ